MSIIEKALNKAKDEGQKLDESTNSSNEFGKNSDIQSNSLNKPVTTFNSNVSAKDEQPPAKEIAEIEWRHLSELGFVAPGDSNTKAIEEYRNIKRPIVSNAFGKGSVGINRANLILVTSSLPGEGKTFTAINLALSIANERDRQVLLIDADVARPSVSKVLGIKSGPGLIDYLDGQDIPFSDVIVNTSMPGFRVVPAGKLHKHSTELLSSNKMALLAEELSSRYPDRIVIFDSPPLLAATQGEILSKLVGQVVLVVEAERTLQSMVMESVDKLASCDVVLAVFNKSNRSMDAGYYGYGYGYGQYAAH
ncbi:MAG: XrtA-associated tyrosine autokinase [Methylococcaceae bacterium]|nr:XrtA-associated tyrosine autokinase [Methylococcaceae bacterium]MDD1626144.1 XrtA-associated tyrosine autokinase [Methylococcaceae bacterium]